MAAVHVVVEQVRSATAVIATGPLGQGEPRGTGFFVAPAYLVTCAHVVEQAGQSPYIWWFGRSIPAKVVAKTPPPVGDAPREGDAAVLKIIEDVNHPCVPLSGGEVLVLDEVWVYGFTEARVSGRPEMDGSGCTIELTPQQDDSMAGPYLTLAKGRITAGMSGGPVLNLSSLGVCGVTQSRLPGDNTGGYAVPIQDALSLVLPGLDLCALNPAHAADLAALRREQTSFGGLPDAVAVRLTPQATKVLLRHIKNELHRDPPLFACDDDQCEWVARQLFRLSMGELIGSLRQLFDVSPAVARSVFGWIAGCVPAGDEKLTWWWISGVEADKLRAEFEQEHSRVALLRTNQDRTVNLFLRRAFETDKAVLKCGGGASGQLGEAGLMQDMYDDIVAAIAPKLGYKAEEWPLVELDELKELWKRQEIVQIDNGSSVDEDYLRPLAHKFPSVRFLMCRRDIDAPTTLDDVLLQLEGVSMTDENRALAAIADFESQIPTS